MEKVLMLASVASMIDQFNMDNIEILQELGYEVHVACNFEYGSTCTDEKVKQLKLKLEEMNVRYYQIDFTRSVFNIKQDIIAYRQVLRIMNNNNYKFIHCHSPIGGVIGRLASKKMKIKCIYTAHGFHFFKGAPIKNWLIYYPVEKLLSNYTDVLITINEEDFEYARKKFKNTNIVYVPGIGVDVKKFVCSSSIRTEKRRELGVSDTDKVLLSVGELIPRKNHKIVIEAIKEIEDSSIKYYICGKGPLFDKYKRLICKLNLEKQVHLLGFRTDINEICQAADAYVFPSLQEGLPVALMEAMACGLPCVVSDIRGNRDLIDDLGGEIVGIKKLCNWKDAIIRIVKSNRCIKGEYNKNKVKAYSKEVVNNNMINIYKGIN